MPIINGNSLPFGSGSGLPQVGGALNGWLQPMTFGVISKSIVGFQEKETVTPVSFQGVLQPLDKKRLMQKPEGQRAWSWYMLHASTALALNVDDVVTYQNIQIRVTAQTDFSSYGYYEYELVQDFTNAGPPTP